MTETAPQPRLSPLYRWLVLVSVSLVCFAQYYIYDSITPLGTLIKSELGFSGSDYGLLFSFYSVANVFLLMLLVAGVLVDKLGLKASGILYGSLCVLGAALTWAGTLPGVPALEVMLLGRMIYGVGAESILVVNNKVIARWFAGRELAFGLGLNLTLMRLGTFLALTVQARAAEAWGLGGALALATAIMAAGFGGFFGYLLLERAARGRPGGPVRNAPTSGAEERFVLREAFSFRFSFWFIALLCVAFYSAVFPFQSYAPDILVQKFGFTTVRAGDVTSALILGTMIFTPLFGLLVDRKGRRATLMVLGALLLVPCHLLLGYTNFPPIVPIFLVGVALSLVPAALWSAIPVMVPESRLGTAFGVVGYVQNVGLMLFPYLAGKIAEAHTTTTLVEGKTTEVVDYTSTMLMFAVLGVVGLAFAIALKWADRREGGQLERPSASTSLPAATASAVEPVGQ